MFTVYNDKEHYLHSGYDFIPLKDGETWCIASTNIGGYTVNVGVYKNKYDVQKEIKDMFTFFRDNRKGIYVLKYNEYPEMLERDNIIKLIKELK